MDKPSLLGVSVTRLWERGGLVTGNSITRCREVSEGITRRLGEARRGWGNENLRERDKMLCQCNSSRATAHSDRRYEYGC